MDRAMTSRLEDLMAYLAGRDDEAARRGRARMEDPTSDPREFLRATQVLSRQALGEHVVAWLGVTVERPQPSAPAPPLPAAGPPFRVVQLVPWVVALLAVGLAGYGWWDCISRHAPSDPAGLAAGPPVTDAAKKPSATTEPVNDKEKTPSDVVDLKKSRDRVLVLESDLKAANATVERLEGEIKKVRAQVLVLETTVEKTKTLHNNVEIQLKDARGQVANLKAELEKTRTLKSDLEASRKKVAGLEADLKTANAEIARLNAALKKGK
jgi:hypothetical protein